MELIEAVNKRKTTRGFTDKPVPREILEKIVTTAQRSPSWGNTQPWEIVVVGGKVLDEIKAGYLARAADPATPDLPFPAQFPEFIRERLTHGDSSRRMAVIPKTFSGNATKWARRCTMLRLLSTC